MSTVVTRFAPSPTGLLHIGTARTALFSWLYSRKHQGKFRLRIEDTDRKRSTTEATNQILESLEWLGLHHDGDVVFQSDRMELYRENAQQLLKSGKAYYCNCSRERLNALRLTQMKQGLKPRYDRKCRSREVRPSLGSSAVVRFKNPIDGTVKVEDIVQGEVVYRNEELDDLIILRGDNSPTYNFSVVVDEIDMGITHVLRGDDHLNNTPRQINLFKAFGQPLPKFGHIPLILSPQGKKLSKRENVDGVLELRDSGYLPDAVINYLVRLGWSHKDQEIFEIDELVNLFDAKNIGRSPSSLNPKKMQWINHQHLMNLRPEEAAQLAKPFFLAKGINCDSPKIENVFEVQKTRCKTFLEFVEKSEYFYKDFDGYDTKAAKKFINSNLVEPLQDLKQELKVLGRWERELIHSAFKKILRQYNLKFGTLAQAVRVALTGNTVSPGIDLTIELIGRATVLERLQLAVEWAKATK